MLSTTVAGCLTGTGAPASAASPAVERTAPGRTAPERPAPGQAAPRGGAPDAPDAPALSDLRRDAAVSPVRPLPRHLRLDRGTTPLAGRRVAVLAAPDADPYALDVLLKALRGAAAHASVLSPSAPPPRAAEVVVHVEEAPRGGEAAAGPRGGLTATERALRALGTRPQGRLPEGGYRLAAARGVVALSGVGSDGLFHAAQTLRQLIDGGRLRDVRVRDWPSARVRGTVESFYGEPWSHAERLAHLDFMGRTKQNRYLYAAGDDPYRLTKWREPYPAEQRERFRELAGRAARNHVTLGWALAPGQDFCFSSPRDRRRLLEKVAEMRALGVGAIQLQFADVSYEEWHCGADRSEFGTGPAAAARAQAGTANALAAGLGAGPALSVLPTEFYQDGDTEYRSALAKALDPGIEVAWSGVSVLPRTITGAELGVAASVFRHPLVTQDNYPVNDFESGRVYLGPYTGREPAVATASAALLASAMRQPLATRIPLFTAADFAWNAQGYESRASWQAALADLARDTGADPAALAALARNSASSALDTRESAYLRPLLAEFDTAYGAGDRARLERAAGPLRAAFAVMRGAPARLGALTEELRPWHRQLARQGEAGEQAVELLLAQARGQGDRARRARLALAESRREIAGGDARLGGGALASFAAKAAASGPFRGGRGGRPGEGRPQEKHPSPGSSSRGYPKPELPLP
ncbi:beta-N-acetylglucosaminidase domain-containing protein [Streptomyces polyrhachis]|uniref:Beta-N-acetylglucosaminidase domain-containing protein n=1 Tax=Streptomyces polyrhachis TaxID=1282885 RepID=A0ABW2GL53_9ACTN